MSELADILNEEFNYKLNFEEWSEPELKKFVIDLLNGKTEYYLDSTFPEKIVRQLLT